MVFCDYQYCAYVYLAAGWDQGVAFYYVGLGVGFSVGKSSLALRAYAALLIFSQGVYTNGAVQLGRIMDAPAFKVWSTALFILILVICIVLHIFTIKGLITGKVLGLAHGWRKSAYRDDTGDKEV